MSAQANPTLALRPMLPADAPLLAEIFRESVLDLTGDDYSAEQQEAWAAQADDAQGIWRKAGEAIDPRRDARGLAGRICLAEGQG